MTPSYSPVEAWPNDTANVRFDGEATSVAVDSEDNVFVFNRGPIPMVVFDRSGRVVDTWGEGEFERPHAIWVDDNDDLFLVDTGGHIVQKRTREGKVLFTIGERGRSARMQSGDWFCWPTDVCVHPRTGDLFVSDGYGNSRVHRFDAGGRHMLSWGEPGADDGQFSLPHGVALLDEERLVVCDRENFRLQTFSVDGEYLEQWHAHHPSAVRVDRSSDAMVVSELGTPMQHGVPNVGCRVCVRNLDGTTVARIGSPRPGFNPDQLFAPHGVAVDSNGDVYVAEVNTSYMKLLGWQRPDEEVVSLRKWTRATVGGS